MIRSIRRIEAPELGAYLRNHAIVHPRYRVHAIDNARVVSEDELLLQAFARSGQKSRPVVTLLLDGRARISAHGRRVWLRAGEAIAMDAKAAIAMRQEGEAYRSLVFEWDVGRLGERPVAFGEVALDDASWSMVRTLWSRFSSDLAGEDDVAELVALLARAGVPVLPRERAEYTEAASEQDRKLSAALDATLSGLDDQPMTADLEKLLGRSTRQVNRLVAAFNERYGYNSAGWRDTRNRRRLMLGATLMTARGATAKYVARVVGYRSAPALARAFADAGLPSPSAIAEAVAALGA